MVLEDVANFEVSLKIEADVLNTTLRPASESTVQCST